MKAALLVLLLLTGCATTKPDTCDDCLTLTKAALVKAMQAAWNDGWGKGWDSGIDNAPPSCMRTI